MCGAQSIHPPRSFWRMTLACGSVLQTTTSLCSDCNKKIRHVRNTGSWLAKPKISLLHQTSIQKSMKYDVKDIHMSVHKSIFYCFIQEFNPRKEYVLWVLGSNFFKGKNQTFDSSLCVQGQVLMFNTVVLSLSYIWEPIILFFYFFKRCCRVFSGCLHSALRRTAMLNLAWRSNWFMVTRKCYVSFTGNRPRKRSHYVQHPQRRSW